MAAAVGVYQLVLTICKLMAGSWTQLIVWAMLFHPAVSGNLRLGSSKENLIQREIPLKDFSYHESVIPKVYRAGQLLTDTLQPGGYVKDMTITFHAFSRDFVLDLVMNSNLFSNMYVEKMVHSRTNQRTHLPVNHSDSHCYYHGRLRGASMLSSSVAVSTCHGIRGQISTGDDLYFMEPVDGVANRSLSAAHYVFKHSDSLQRNVTCIQTASHPRTKRTISNDEVKRYKKSLSGSARVLEPRDADDLTRYVELYVVNDYSQYAALNYRVDEVIRRTKDIINIVSSIYRPLNMYVILVGVEVWTERNQFAITENSENTMNKFLEYRRKHINPFHRNDNAQLIIGQELGNGIVGKAPIMTICTYQTSGGVNADRHSSLGAISTTVAHEMGHNFGLYHDLDSCECEDSRCIMSSEGGRSNPTKWSSCSRQVLSDTFHQGMDYCLRNMPQVTYIGPTCGNGFKEDGEECDCGLEQDCTNLCCIASTCRLAPNATCATGHCCDLGTCQPMSSATECRASRGFCDLPEFCDGISEHCPSNVYVEDGVDCEQNWVSSYCYRGECKTHDGQCQMLWGRTGKMSNNLCFEYFNIMGSAHGHCGFNWTDESFQKCQPKDVLCGMLHCEHRSEKLMFWKEALMFTMPDTFVRINDLRHDCKGAIMDVGLDMPDPGMTFDGVKCGDSQICLSHRCVHVESLKTKPCPDCHGHGVCNSLGQCHCDLGYAPPFCDYRGLGGSVHSGPAQKYLGSSVGLIVGLCLLFLCVIPLFVILAILAYRYYDQLKLFLVRRCRQCQTSSFYKKRFQKTDVKDIEMSTTEVTVVRSTSSVSAKSPGIRRAVSFRPEDISSPFLQSSTNSTLNLPEGAKTPASLIHANSCRAAITYAECKTRPARPAPPKFPIQKDGGSTALSSNSISSHSSDLSSASGAGDSHYLLPKQDNHKETQEVLQPSRKAPLPPYACPKKKTQSKADPSPLTKPLLESVEKDTGQHSFGAEDSTFASQYVNLPSSHKEPDDVPSSDFYHRPSKNSSSCESKTNSQTEKPSDSKYSSSETETKSQVNKPSISQLKRTFEAKGCNSSTPRPTSDSVSPHRENSLPFRQASTGRADAGTTPTSGVDTPSSSSQTVLPKRPPYGRLETTPSAVKLQHSASDSVASFGRIARPTVAPKPPSGVRTSSRS